MKAVSVSNQQHGYDWTHPSLVSRVIPGKGLGVVTLKDIEIGELLIVFGGRVVNSDYLRVNHEGQDIAIQIEEDLFFLPIDNNAPNVADRINHSCSPNAGFQDQMSIVAMRHIAEGTEICMDYATCSATADVQPPFECACGQLNCRGVITSDDWKRVDLQSNLKGYFQPFLKRRIAELAITTLTGVDLFSKSEVPSLCLRDVERTKAFKEAISRVVRPGDIVVDAGSGSGVLAMFAAAAGAKKVYAIEANQAIATLLSQNAKLNGFEEVINVVNSDVRALRLQENVDVLIAEMIDTWLLDELQIPALNSLRQNQVIGPHTRVIPSGYTAYIEFGFVDFECYGLKLPFPCHDWPDLILENGWIPMYFLSLTGKTVVFEVDFSSTVEPSFDLVITVDVLADGKANAVRLSGIAKLDQRISLGETVAFNGDKILPIDEVSVSAGQAVSFRLKGSRGGTVGLVQCSVLRESSPEAMH